MRLPGLSLVVLTTFAMGSAKAQNDTAVQFGAGPLRGLTCAECGRKAVQAMDREKFLFAEVDAEGNVRGWSEKAAVTVLIWPGPDGVQFLVTAASRDGAEAERIRNAVRSFLEQAPIDPKAPARIGSADSLPKSKLPAIHFRHEQRAVVPTLQFFEPGVSIAFQKQGISLSHSEKFVVMGSGPRGLASTFLGPASNGLSAHLCVVAVSWDETSSSRLTDTVWREVVKVLFE
ncbi:MAG TPA: hypothetical protein VE999_15665 [Gemmataceae bacterium]|nr:hypothetical protein [Gemmataceae bacterium]